MYGYHDFMFAQTKKTNSFELVIIDCNEVFIHFYGSGEVISSTLHIVGEKVADKFIEIYERLHGLDYDPDIFKIEFMYLREDDDSVMEKVEKYFALG